MDVAALPGHRTVACCCAVMTNRSNTTERTTVRDITTVAHETSHTLSQRCRADGDVPTQGRTRHRRNHVAGWPSA